MPSDGQEWIQMDIGCFLFHIWFTVASLNQSQVINMFVSQLMS